MVRAYVITDPCVGVKDASCIDVCPVDCIHPLPGTAEFAEAPQLYIDPTECIDCGACLEVCPVGAIYPNGELPAALASFIETNARYFDSVDKGV